VHGALLLSFTVELPIWNTIGTGPKAIPYDGYSTADEINKKIILF
jgi:hypothetical protein